ncbi:LysR substrate-binding domain-containing protein [Taklimakanibacter deserti]|uniref:LysR substrate-binding domain-containing protein n=1 Tax=Taklimakanibacter deserti TaxID=2267839 RepID=UPI000E656890
MVGQKHIAGLPWTALRAFEAASRLGSFKAAAQELTLTPTAISHQIRRLETHLGASLFERLHRGLRLTPTGKVLARDVQKLFAGLENSLERLMREGRAKEARALSVSVVPSLASKWLAPRLHGFQSRHPQIGLRIVSDEVLVDFKRDRAVDIALRYGPGTAAKGLYAERLWPKVEIIAVCRPDIAKDIAPGLPDRLKRQSLLRTAPPRARSPTGRLPHVPDWTDWLSAAGIALDADRRKALDGPVFNTTQLAVEAAVAGRGVALAPHVLVEADIASGRLVRLSSTRLADPNSFWLLCRADRFKDSRIQAFVKWIRQEAGRT